MCCCPGRNDCGTGLAGGAVLETPRTLGRNRGLGALLLDGLAAAVNRASGRPAGKFGRALESQSNQSLTNLVLKYNL